MTKIEMLVVSVQAEAQQARRSKDWINSELSTRLDKLLRDEGWYVECSVTKERIPYTELRYWSVPLQVAYARPELIDHAQFGY